MSNKTEDESNIGTGFVEAVRYIVHQSPTSLSVAVTVTIIFYLLPKAAQYFSDLYQ